MTLTDHIGVGFANLCNMLWNTTGTDGLQCTESYVWIGVVLSIAAVILLKWIKMLYVTGTLMCIGIYIIPLSRKAMMQSETYGVFGFPVANHSTANAIVMIACIMVLAACGSNAGHGGKNGREK